MRHTAIAFDAATGTWLHFDRPRLVLDATTPDEVLPVVREATALNRNRGWWATGYLAYEASPAFDPRLSVRDDGAATHVRGRTPAPLAWFAFFDEVHASAERPLPVEHDGAAARPWTPDVDERTYVAAIASVKDAIARGHTYQVNYTYRLRSCFDGDPQDAFARLLSAQGPCLAVYLDTGRWAICSASPELFFTLDDGRLVSRPMKGTAARGLLPEEDRAAAERLRHSPKEQAENVMIVDMVRNDMGRVAIPGTVEVPRLFDVEQYRTIWQMTSTVACVTRAGFAEVLTALFPAASITGAPKVRTMELIAALETTPRGVYTGASGFLAPDGRAQWNVAIRTMVLDRETGVALYGIGGGITWDSDPRAEYEESIAKARILDRPWPAFDLLETLLWTPDAGYVLLDEHMDRLERANAYFGFAAGAEGARGALLDAADASSWSGPMRVRLLASEGGAVRVDAVALAPSDAKPGVIRLAATPMCSADPFLHYKTTNRAVYDAARKSVAHGEPAPADVLLWNERRELTESTIANVAVAMDGRLATPPLTCGLLDGTMRARLLRKGEIVERVIRIDQLANGTEIVLFNSVRGIWRASLER